MEENDFVSIWLEESANPAIQELTRLNQQVADQVGNFLSEKGLSSADLSTILDIHHTEINRWLNGMHAFSAKTLKQMTQTLADQQLRKHTPAGI